MPAHALDDALPRPRSRLARVDATGGAGRAVAYEALDERASPSRPPPFNERDRDHRSGGRASCSCPPRPPTPTSSRRSGSSIPTATRSCFQGRSTRTRRSPTAGCAPRTASSTPSAAPPWRPYHPHDEVQPLTPGEVYELDIEIWPTSIVDPGRLPTRAHGPRPRLRVRGPGAGEHVEPLRGFVDARRRDLHPQRPRKPAGRRLRRVDDTRRRSGAQGIPAAPGDPAAQPALSARRVAQKDPPAGG